MWIGVTSGFAIRKFSGSVNMLGANINRLKNINRVIMYPSMSLIE